MDSGSDKNPRGKGVGSGYRPTEAPARHELPGFIFFIS